MSTIYTTLWRSRIARSSLLRRPHLVHAIQRHGCGGGLGGGADIVAVPRWYYSESDWSSWSSDELGIDGPDEPAEFDAGDSFQRHTNTSGALQDSHRNQIQTAPAQRRRRHLYVALDDWRKGFSLYKLDLFTDGYPEPQANQQTRHRRLPPPTIRLEFSDIDKSAPLVAIGSKIVAWSSRKDGLTVIYDVDTGGQAIAHCSPKNVLHREWCQAAMVAGRDTLYAFVCSLYHHGTYAVHPGGKTISVSVLGEHNLPLGTYSYDTESHEWTHQGTWMLPFSWQAHYDDELDALVGHDAGYGVSKIGCCDVPSLGTDWPPIWKLCDDSLLSGLTCLSAKLVSVGGGYFCFVEIGPRERVDMRCCIGDGDKCELRVTTFRARYGKNGQLQITDRRLAHSYVLSRYEKLGYAIKAFWL
ncbi:hypothetical protein HU200_061386 [Digitaria exilis]|uniref:Uncharacterized protein n=1 Tax=Digitaria exilis TaxID=1010633 RepID=A0A835E1F6_9POAL|nr:hypothetical protein HU200_061386 [Digitaria exilis]